MKQKLEAEQHLKALVQSDKDELPAQFKGLDSTSEEFALLSIEEVGRFASESAVMNVHELLDVKPDVEEVEISIYDHFRRVGVHRFAPIFEHFGLRTKKDLNEDFISRME